MCGIAGVLVSAGAHLDPGSLRMLADRLAHRGPDDSGEYLDEGGGIGLAFKRLSIIDPSSGGHQPMVAEDAGIVMVFNGELYNFQALRETLKQQGHAFKSRSDSEVVLRSFVQWGPACLERFCGMFALAIWNSRTKRLYLARDPTGMKPLYYWSSPKGVFFASEVKAFLKMPGFKPRADLKALQQYVEFGYCYEETRTSLQDVSKVPPGTWLELEAGRVIGSHTFYSPPAPSAAPAPSLEQAADGLHQTLSEVVREHLVADVPVGLLLSGGLDSSLIAALAARQQKVLTVCMAFAQSKIDERPQARAVAEFIGSEHVEVLIEPGEVVKDLADTVRTFDDLFADWGTLSTRILYQRCRERGIKAVLVGEGADELFGGYGTFDAALRLRGPMMWRLFQLYRIYASRRYGAGFPGFARIMQSYLAQTGNDLFSAVRLFESRRQLPNNYVMKVDKASMSVSVEARAPYLDRRIADIAYRTPSSLLIRDGTNKVILRSVAQRHALLPEAIAKRSKFGASMASSWMEEVPVMRDYAREVVLDPKGWTEELGLRAPMEAYFKGKRGFGFPHPLGIFSHLAWRMLLLNLWSRHYLAPAA